MFKICILNHKEKWHPFFFKEMPRPSEYDEPYCRHLSTMHHTDGFVSYDSAHKFVLDFINNNPIKFTFSTYSCTLSELGKKQLEVYLERETNYSLDTI